MQNLVNYIYIISAGLFVLSLKWLNSPASARRGVFAGEIGMLLAVAATFIKASPVHNLEWIIAAMVMPGVSATLARNCSK